MQSKLISNNYQLMFFYLLNNRRPVVSVADFLHSNDSHTIYASCVHIYCVASTDSAIYLKIYLDRLISKFNRNLKLQWFLNWSSRPSQRYNNNRISFLKSQLSKLFFLPLFLFLHYSNYSWSSVLFQTSIYSWDDLKKGQGNLLWLSLSIREI